jgi:hypothetical protein
MGEANGTVLSLDQVSCNRRVEHLSLDTGPFEQ